MKKTSRRDPELCQGCRLCSTGKIPRLKTEDQERRFWANHSPLDFPDDFKDVALEVMDLRPKKIPISIRLDPLLKDRVKRLADIKHIGYQTLIQKWIYDKFHEEEYHLIKVAGRKKRPLT